MTHLAKLLIAFATPALSLAAQSTCTPTINPPTFVAARSHFFDLKAPANGSGVTITDFRMLASSGNYTLHYRTGGWAGYDTDPSAWTPVCGGAVNSSNQTIAVPNLSVAPGETIGIALIGSNSSTFVFNGPYTSPASELQFISGTMRNNAFAGTSSNYAPKICFDWTPGLPANKELIYNDELNGSSFQQGQPQLVSFGSIQTGNAQGSLSTGRFVRWKINGYSRPFLDPSVMVDMHADMTLTRVYADPVPLTINATCNGNAASATMTCSPADLDGTTQASGGATLLYHAGPQVSINAPPFSDECVFVRWNVDGVPQATNERILSLNPSTATSVSAEYESPACVQTDIGTQYSALTNNNSSGVVNGIGFDFPLPAGGTTNIVNISSNGFLYLGSGGSSSATSVNSLTQQPPRICAFATPLDITGTDSGIYIKWAPGSFTVTWKDVRVAGQVGRFTVQCTLYESDRVQFSHSGALPQVSAIVGVVAGSTATGTPQAVDIANQPEWSVQEEAGWYWAPTANELTQQVLSSAPIDGGFTGVTFANSCTQTSVVSYGSGCSAPASFYQITDGADLVSKTYILTPNGSAGYTFELSPTSLFESSLGTATNIGDDDLHTVNMPFSFDFPTSATGTSTIDVCSNGYVWLESSSSNTVLPNPNTSEFFAQGPRVAPFWVDLDPTDSLSDDVYVNTHSDRVVITWNDCVRFLTNLNLTAQCVLFDDGTIHLNYGSPTYAAANVLAGFSPGNGTGSTPATEFATHAPFGTGSGNGLPLELSSTDFPTIGTDMTLHVTNLPVYPTIGIRVIGFQQASMPLGTLGAPDCWMLSSTDIVEYDLVTTAEITYSLTLPSQPALSGMSLFLQYAAYAPDVNAFGFVTSNGLELVLGDI